MKQYGFGVDIGGTTCKIGFFDMSGTVLEKWEIKTNTENGGASILDDVAAEVLGKLQEKGIKKEDVQGIGLGVPGPVGSDGTVYKCVNLGWDIFNVETELYKKTGLLVKAGNDANVAALGEMWQGGGKGHEDVVMITLGTGVGGGIIIGGRIVAGHHGAGGEIGHILMREDSGETRATKLNEIRPLTAKDIFDAAKEGDTVALELTDQLCGILATAMSSISCVADPEIFVVGGGVSKAGAFLIEGIKKHFVEKAFHASEGTEIALATLGNDAGMYGCVRLLF